MHVLRRDIKRVELVLCCVATVLERTKCEIQAMKYELCNFSDSAYGSNALKFAFKTGIAHYEVDW